MTTDKTIIFITGAFVSHHIWDGWKSFFQQKGFTVLVPPWPHKDAAVESLRASLPHNAEFAKMRLSHLVEHYKSIVASLPEKPIVIGHSLGGLIVQLLVNQNLVAAGVALHSVPPKGVFSFEWSFLKAIWKPLGYPFGRKIYFMSLKTWSNYYANGLNEQIQKGGYESYCIPESRQIIRDALGVMATVDFEKPHPPLLLTAGTEDKFVPLSLNYENYIRYRKDHYITDYKKFAGRNHFVLMLPGLGTEAEYVHDWITILNLK